MGTKRKRVDLSLEDKFKLIKESESGKSQRLLAQMFGCGKTQVQTTLKDKDKYVKAYLEDNLDGSKKRLKFSSPYEELNTVVWEWFVKCTSANLPISGPLIQEKAKEFATQLNLQDFKASNGWLDAFKKRHSIHHVKLVGERASVDTSTVTSFKDKLPTLIAGYACMTSITWMNLDFSGEPSMTTASFQKARTLLG